MKNYLCSTTLLPARLSLRITCLLVTLCLGAGASATTSTLTNLHPPGDCQPQTTPPPRSAAVHSLADQAIAVTRFDSTIEASDPATGAVIWTIEGTALQGDPAGDFRDLARTVSPAQRATIRWCDRTCVPRDVFLFGGGYDPLINRGPVTVQRSSGNAVYMVDASSGRLIWSAGAGDYHALPLDRMRHSIAAGLTVLDKNDDCYADTLFAIDIVGNLFRIDLQFSPDAPEHLAEGGMIADIGGGARNFRQFVNAADISLLTAADGTDFFTVSAASGNPHQAAGRTVQNYLFVLFVPVSNPPGTTNGKPLITPDHLSVAGQDPVSANGWYMPLTGTGERAASDTTTINQWIVLLTITPLWNAATDAFMNVGRAYVLDALTGESRLHPDALAERLANRQDSMATRPSQQQSPLYLSLGAVSANATPSTTVQSIADCAPNCQATAVLTTLTPRDSMLTTCLGDACQATAITLPLYPLYWRAN